MKPILPSLIPWLEKSTERIANLSVDRSGNLKIKLADKNGFKFANRTIPMELLKSGNFDPLEQAISIMIVDLENKTPSTLYSIEHEISTQFGDENKPLDSR